MLRVTTVIPCTNAVTVMSASRSERRSGTWSLAQHCATGMSTGKMRSWKAVRNLPSSQERSTAPWVGSRRSIERMPVSSSSTVIDGQEETWRGDAVGPCQDSRFGPRGSPFPQFRNDVGVEQIHQDRSGSRISLSAKRGGSNSTSATWGMASDSTMLAPFSAIL